MYEKLKKTFEYGHINHMPRFYDTFPELKSIDSEEMAHRFKKLELDYFTETETPVKTWVRFTLPIALLTMLLMVVTMPIAFMITGKWGYALGSNNRILNWFRMLKLNN